MLDRLKFTSATMGSTSRMRASARMRRLQGGLALAVVANVALLIYLVRMPGNSPEARQRQLDELQQHHDALQTKVQSQRDLAEKMQTTTRNESEFAQDNFLPRSTAFSSMVENLQELAVKNEVSPSDIDFQLKDETNDLGWINVEVTLSVAGGYGDLVQFVNELEQSELFWIIRGLDVSGPQGRELRLNLRMETFFLPS
jgi:Tfp pilus assembly protein PilO